MKVLNELLPILSTAITRYLLLDSEAKSRLHLLAGKVVSIQFSPFNFQFYCVFKADRIELMSTYPGTVDTQITGTPLQMISILIAKENRQRFFAEDVTIIGDAEVGQAIVHLLDELEIDWEEHLSSWIGDAPAYHLARLGERIKQTLKDSDERFSRDMNEFLHEEVAWFPTREALHDFFHDVDDLRHHAERLETRLNHLRDYLSLSENDT